MNTRKRLEALEKARVGGDVRPVELWTQDQADPRMFTLEGSGERLTRDEVEARPAQVILMTRGENP